MDRWQVSRHEALTGRRSMSRRHDRLQHSGAPPAVPVVDQAACSGRSCRSCVAVSLADCIALGCCPCAVVSLLGLALVKAPLAVGRRCVRRLRRRQGRLRHKKRVRDLDPAGGKCAGEPAEKAAEDDAASPGRELAASEAEKVWLEMYRVGQWGFGRLSFSVTPPARATGRESDGDGRGNDL